MNITNSHHVVRRQLTSQPRTILTICLIVATGAGIGLSLGFGCKSSAPAGKHSTNVDPKREERATVVLRVERVTDHGGSKYHWVTVKPLRVLKNASKAKLTKPLRIAYHGGKQGVPAGISTVYLQPYGDGASGHWLLLGGDATAGVSHREKR